MLKHNKQTLSEDEAKQAMEDLGKRLAYLVYLAPLTDEARAEIIQTLPFMSFEQIDNLAHILEEGVKESTGDAAKDELLAKLNSVFDNYNQDRQTIDAKAVDELKKIEGELNQTENANTKSTT